MGKDKSPARFAENQAGATAKFIRVPPRKARLVLDAVRGKYVTDALAVLKFVPNFAARAIEKTIGSAVANAENGRPVSEASGRQLAPLIRENLKLVRAWIDEGPRIKRVRPRAQGRAYRIIKRMCHITVIVEETAPRERAQRRLARPAQSAAGRPAVTRPKTAPVAATAPAEPQAPAERPAPQAVVDQSVKPAAVPETPAGEAPAEDSGKAR